VSKRDRDRDDRDRDRRGDRDREDSRKERDDGRRGGDEFARRDREPDKELDTEDPRRWRDDGKRDERIATRRDRFDRDRERTRDKILHEGGHEPSHDRHQDRRWTAEERDVRSKRSSGRDRRSGGAVEENKEKDDRKDREREKEKEPAWMDTYIPSDSSPGILGGKVANGELDGIQAWKKGMKAKEQGDKSTSKTKDGSKEVLGLEQQLDEIQLFRLMMKREEKKRTEGKDEADTSPVVSFHGIETPVRTRDPQKDSLVSGGEVLIRLHIFHVSQYPRRQCQAF